MHECYGGVLEFDELPTAPKDRVKAPWNELLLIDLCKIRINCIGFANKYYVEIWIRAIATGISVSPEAFLRDSLSYPPDLVVDDSQEHMDDTYVDSANQEEMVEEADEYEQEEFQYDDNVD